MQLNFHLSSFQHSSICIYCFIFDLRCFVDRFVIFISVWFLRLNACRRRRQQQCTHSSSIPMYAKSKLTDVSKAKSRIVFSFENLLFTVALLCMWDSALGFSNTQKPHFFVSLPNDNFMNLFCTYCHHIPKMERFHPFALNTAVWRNICIQIVCVCPLNYHRWGLLLKLLK